MSKVEDWPDADEVRAVIAKQMKQQGALWGRTGATLIMSDLANAGFKIVKEGQE